jgi:glutaredoxin
MTATRIIEIYSAGCPACQEAIDLVTRITCSSCEVVVRDMNDINVVKDAKRLGIHRVPAITVDGKLAACCGGAAVDEAMLRGAGIGTPL